MSGGENFDFCEYVYNPLMRQYQAMIRLMSMLSDSQSDCNDIQCFTSNDPTNPMSNLVNPASQTSTSFLTTYVPVLFVWALVVFALFMFRPASMRGNGTAEKDANKSKKKSSSMNSNNNRFSNYRDDDDDNSTVS